MYLEEGEFILSANLHLIVALLLLEIILQAAVAVYIMMKEY